MSQQSNLESKSPLHQIMPFMKAVICMLKVKPDM